MTKAYNTLPICLALDHSIRLLPMFDGPHNSLNLYKVIEMYYYNIFFGSLLRSHKILRNSEWNKQTVKDCIGHHRKSTHSTPKCCIINISNHWKLNWDIFELTNYGLIQFDIEDYIFYQWNLFIKYLLTKGIPKSQKIKINALTWKFCLKKDHFIFCWMLKKLMSGNLSILTWMGHKGVEFNYSLPNIFHSWIRLYLLTPYLKIYRLAPY